MKTITKNQNSLCWTSTCAMLLLHIQNAAHHIFPAFYYERRVSHNDRLLSILSETAHEKEKSLLLIKKELFIYNYFAKNPPQTVADWNKMAKAAETAYTSATASEINLLDKITEPLLRFISTPQTPEFVYIHNTLITNKELQLFEIFKHISIQINYLKD